LLGSRLKFCAEAVLAIEGRSSRDIFGSPDDMKFGSSMTLFALASSNNGNVFRQALDRYCAGRLDPRTEALLAQGSMGK